MKNFLIIGLFFSLGLQARVNEPTYVEGYEPNSGKAAPGTFTNPEGAGDVVPETRTTPSTADIAREEQEERGKTLPPSESGENSVDRANTGLTPTDMNTSPNPTPGEANQTDKFNRTLSTGEVRTQENGRTPADFDEEIEAEEDELDYSTSPGRQ